jgi:LacI family transcriptional regulator
VSTGRKKRLRAATHDQKERRPTIRDVARLADVGVGTVSRVINNHPTVKSDIRRVVTNAIAQLSYVPDALAGSMRRGQTRVVGCIFRTVSLPAMAPLLSGAESVFSQAGSTMVFGTTENRESELAYVRSFAQRRIDGLLMTLSNERDAEVLAAIAHYKMKTVFINREVPAAQGVVLIDHRTGVLEAVRTLIELGHRRISLVTIEGSSYHSRTMIEGFREAHRAAGLTAREDLIRAGAAHSEAGFQETANLLSGSAAPTAIVVGAYSLLVGTLRAIRYAGLAIGRDISLVADGDSNLAEQMIPAISAIRWDRYEMGRTAARLLMDSVAGRGHADERRVIIPTEFVMRESCERVRA